MCLHDPACLASLASQVCHFFKVGAPRAQGKTLLLCLAQQLAEKLPGMADLLVKVVEEHGDGAQLSLADTFNWWVGGRVGMGREAGGGCWLALTSPTCSCPLTASHVTTHAPSAHPCVPCLLARPHAAMPCLLARPHTAVPCLLARPLLLCRAWLSSLQVHAYMPTHSTTTHSTMTHSIMTHSTITYSIITHPIMTHSTTTQVARSWDSGRGASIYYKHF